MDWQIQGKRTIVTGSSSGIGEAIAKVKAIIGFWIIQFLALAIKTDATKENLDTMIGIYPSTAGEFFTL